MTFLANATLMWGALNMGNAPTEPWVLSPPDGHSVSSAIAVGDVDADGFADVGAFSSGNSLQSTINVYRGGATGPSTTPDQSFTIGGRAYFSDSVLAGDFDGDGHPDLLVPMPFADVTHEDEGRLALFRGGPDLLETTPAWTFAGGDSGTFDGFSEGGIGFYAAAGDFNGDGHLDVVASAPGYAHDNGSKGTVFVFLGTAAGLPAAPDRVITPPVGEYYTGPVLALDVDGDGRDELGLAVVSDVVQLVLFQGTATGLAAEPEPSIVFDVDFSLVDVWNFEGGAPRSGDFDGDGRDDIVWGFWLANGVQAHYATDEGFSDVADWSLTNPFDKAEMPALFAHAFGIGQIDGQHADDLVIANWDDFGNGGALVVASSANGLVQGTSLAIRSEEIENFGWDAPVVGDVDGDGYGEIAMSFFNVESGVRVYPGGPFTECEEDTDEDGVCDDVDNCPEEWNPKQEDIDEDGIGDACEAGASTGGGDETGTDDGGSAQTDGGSTSGDDGSSSMPAVTTTAADDTGAATDDGLPQGSVAETGCGCRSSDPGAGGGWLLLLAAGWLVRRRRAGVVLAAVVAGCVEPPRMLGPQTSGDTPPSLPGTTGETDGSEAGGESGPLPPPTDYCCSDDRTSIVNCGTDEVISTCGPTGGCSPSAVRCVDGCLAAEEAGSSTGCEYYAVPLSYPQITVPDGSCFAVTLSNAWAQPAHVDVRLAGSDLDLDGALVLVDATSGEHVLEPVAEIPAGETAAVLLMGTACGDGEVVRPAIPEEPLEGGGITSGFHIVTDVPVVAHQVSPFLGAQSHITGASLLHAVASWGDNFTALAPAEALALPVDVPGSQEHVVYRPSLSIVASRPGTTVSLLPTADIEAAPGVPASAAGEPLELELEAGEHLQIVQEEGLTGTIIAANGPVGVWVGHECAFMPDNATMACDHLEQMLPPLRALGSRYAVGSVQRVSEAGLWRVFGAVDGTELVYSGDVGGPTSLERGEARWIQTDRPFVVSSQDPDHPFYLFNYMTGAHDLGEPGILEQDLLGDPDFVSAVPPEQWLDEYAFFVDPAYIGQLVFVRRRADHGTFAPVEVDCDGWREVGGWQAFGDGAFELARVRTEDPAHAACIGRVAARSAEPFGLHVWGLFAYTSLGFPAGQGLAGLNDIYLPPEG